MRINIIACAMVIGLTVLIAPGAKAAAPTDAQPVALQRSVVVEDRIVRLGDLFANAGDKADTVVAYAPLPGKRAIFDAQWLYRVARAYGLEWRPLSIHEQAVVTRDSTVIGREEISARILEALVDRGADPDMTVSFSNSLLRIYVAGNAPATIAVEDAAYDPRSRRFTAIVVAPADDPAAQRIRITGRLYKMTEVPVLAERIGKDTVITEDHIRWIKMRSRLVQRDIILDAADLIGKTPRRGVRAGIPVRATEVRRPLLVTKGSLVTMVFNTPFMHLTALGRALDEGAQGQTIRIANMQSNKVVAAVVTGTNKVKVQTAGHLAMN